MEVWLEGVEDASLAGINVFRTWENVKEHWRLNHNAGKELLDSLDEDARRLMNGTAIFAEIGLYTVEEGKTVHYCARPVVVDDWNDTAADRVEALKGVRFTRDEIEDARRILNSVEQVLDMEDGKCTRKQEKRYAAE